MQRLLIKNGTLINDTGVLDTDLLIETGKVVKVTPQIHDSTAEVIDASMKLILPGGVDAHTHFDLPMFGTVSSDDHYTGHKAAAFGGTTTVIDFVPFDQPTLRESIIAWHEKAKNAAVDYSFHMNMTRFNPQVAREIPSLVEEGITTLKVFTAYNGRLRLDDESISRLMRIAKIQGMLVMAHCEDGDEIEKLTSEAVQAGHTEPIWHARTRTAHGAAAATQRICEMAGEAGAPVYFVHMNTREEVEALVSARSNGTKAMGETCPQYLLFTEEDLLRPDGAKWICSPPLRLKEDTQRLWQALTNGEIQAVCTDHCAFFFDGSRHITYEGKEIAIPGKELGRNDFTKIPNGLPGVGDRLPVMWTMGVNRGKITPLEFVQFNCSNPAKIFGLYPRKGTLLPGSDADIVIWDPNNEVDYGMRYSQQRTDYNLYEGWKFTGMPEKVFLRGQLIVNEGDWLGHPGMGQFQPRQPFAPLL